MAQRDLTTTLTELLEPHIEEHGMELVAVEQTGGRRQPVIRVLLDREGGVTIDAICEANGWVSEVLEAADPIPGSYVLEVSSPGIDRPLRTREHFQRFAGQTVTVKGKTSGHGRSAWTGTLLGMRGDDIALEIEGEMVLVPFDSVQKARLKGVVSFGKEGGVS